ncbi:MAG: hypothetical protein R3A47_11035 [Polyangiales bacterium]
MNSRVFLVGLLVVALSILACDNRKLRPLLPCTVAGVVQDVPIDKIDAVDLLFMIDNSSSMDEEQAKLVVEIPRLVDTLLNGELDCGGDPTCTPETFPPVTNLRVGVVTSNMGTGDSNGFGFPGCSGNGDNAQLRSADGAGMSCSGGNSIYYDYQSGMTVRATFDAEVDCATDQGTDGCGFEQQLAATSGAFTNPGNAGFLRSNALLAIIMVTDEEDCSTTNSEVFNPDSTSLEGPFTTTDEVKREERCWAFRDQLTPISDFVSGILATKGGNPEQIVFAAITGVPNAVVEPSDNANLNLDDYDAVLADPRMEQRPFTAALSAHPFYNAVYGDTTNTAANEVDQANEKLVPVCIAADGSDADNFPDGRAFPAVRIVETAKGLSEAGVGTVVRSICDPTYTDTLNTVISKIGSALRKICLPRPLTRGADGKVNCEVVEVQPEGVSCASVGNGRSETAVRTEEGREVCAVTQLALRDQDALNAANTASEAGWFYDDFSPDTTICSYDTKQRVSFTEVAKPDGSGKRIRFECLQSVAPAQVDIGTPCGGDNSVCTARTMESLNEQYDREGLQLFCESASNTCQLSCERDAQCPGAYSCQTTDEDGNALPQGLCVNATCTLN